MSLKHDLVFTKAVASGNDFIIIDNRSGELDAREIDWSHVAKDLCRRRLSIGADGLLVLEASRKADFRMRVINPDGSEVDMCGNGARCSCLYATRVGWGASLKFETGAGILEADVVEESVKIKMSDPKDTQLEIKLGVDTNIMVVHFINTGVQHVVHLVDGLESYQVNDIGKKIREHTEFAPLGTNANFVGDISGNTASLRTYERGVEGETLACGTGTVASAVVLGLLGLVSSPVKMKTQSGEVLTVYYEIKGNKITDVYLEGQAGIVCVGKA